MPISDAHVKPQEKHLKQEWPVKVDCVAEEVGMSHGQAHSILSNNLGVSTLSV